MRASGSAPFQVSDSERLASAFGVDRDDAAILVEHGRTRRSAVGRGGVEQPAAQRFTRSAGGDFFVEAVGVLNDDERRAGLHASVADLVGPKRQIADLFGGTRDAEDRIVEIGVRLPLRRDHGADREGQVGAVGIGGERVVGDGSDLKLSIEVDDQEAGELARGQVDLLAVEVIAWEFIALTLPVLPQYAVAGGQRNVAADEHARADAGVFSRVARKAVELEVCRARRFFAMSAKISSASFLCVTRSRSVDFCQTAARSFEIPGRRQNSSTSMMSLAAQIVSFAPTGAKRPVSASSTPTSAGGAEACLRIFGSLPQRRQLKRGSRTIEDRRRRSLGRRGPGSPA